VRALAVVKDLAASRHGRFTLAVAAVLVLLAGTRVAIWFGPVGTGLVAGPVIAVILVFLARRAGLSWDDLGLARRAVRRGALWAAIAVVVVAAVLLAGVAVPWIRSAFFDVRYQLDAGSALVTALLVVPLSTILLEEIAFRGVLFGLLHQRQRTAWAFGVSSTLFGLWHILPSLPAGKFGTVVAVVGITALLGLLLCELRRRSGSLLAAVGGHWAANGLGVLLAALLWSST
jgi:membrane protease YdiL (CAAX protease family)